MADFTAESKAGDGTESEGVTIMMEKEGKYELHTMRKNACCFRIVIYCLRITAYM